MNYYALRVAPQSEFDVQRALNQKEIPAFVPREYKWTLVNPKSRHRQNKPFPLFPRYVFAGFKRDLALEFRGLAIDEIQGAVSRRRGEWSPLVMSAADVALVRSMADREPSMTTFDIHKALKPGGQARIVLGPFAGQTVKIDRIMAKKATVLLKVLNSMHVVPIPIMALDAA